MDFCFIGLYCTLKIGQAQRGYGETDDEMVANLVLFCYPRHHLHDNDRERIKGRKGKERMCRLNGAKRCGCTIMKLKDELTMDLMRSLVYCSCLCL